MYYERLYGNYGEYMFACSESWISDSQGGMSKEADGPDYEYRRRLCERQRHGAIGFHRATGAMLKVA